MPRALTATARATEPATHEGAGPYVRRIEPADGFCPLSAQFDTPVGADWIP